MASTKWDDPDRDILSDIAAMAESVQVGGRVAPDTMVVNIEQYAWLVLGRYLSALTIHLSGARTYKLPKYTLWQHLQDCFGWKRPPDRFDAFCRDMIGMYRRAYPQVPGVWARGGGAVGTEIIRGRA